MMIIRIFHLCVFAMLIRSSASLCNICANGGSISAFDQPLSLPGYEFIQTCGQLEGFLPLLAQESQQCQLLESIGTYCGCPRGENSCNLCPDGSNVVNADGKMPFLAFMFDGLVPTCELAQSYFESVNATDDFCLLGRALLAGYCGCPNVPYDDSAESCNTCRFEGALITNRTINIPGFPFTTCSQLDDAVKSVVKVETEACNLIHRVSAWLCGCPAPQDPCTLCKDGTNVTLPKKKAHFARDILFGIIPTCEIVEAYTYGHDIGSDFCELARLGGSFCGCASVPDHCEYCPSGDGFPEELDRVDSQVITIDEELKIEPTCELFEATQFQLRRDDGLCILGKLGSFLCGCNGGKFNYAGADTQAKKDALTWITRVACILSLVGTLLTQYDVLSNKRRRQQVYNRLILMMSFFDAFTAIGLVIGPAAMTDTNFLGTPLNYPGSNGTTATCKIQGFLIELGITSIYYNLVLSMYYKWTIVNGWREEKLKRNQKWFHSFALGFGVSSAAIGIPFYDITPFGCHLYPIPVSETYPWMIPLAYLPVLFTISWLTGVMVYIYYKVHAQDKKARKWRISDRLSQQSLSRSSSIRGSLSKMLSRLSGKENAGKSKLVQQVYWQAVAYVGSFLITWPILVVGFLNADSWAVSNYPFWVVFSFCIPLQGFNNAWVYFRPRISNRFEIRRQKRKEERKRRRSEKLVVSAPAEVTDSTVQASMDTTNLPEESGSPDPGKFRRRNNVLREMRYQDPSAYIAMAGLSFNSIGGSSLEDESGLVDIQDGDDDEAGKEDNESDRDSEEEEKGNYTGGQAEAALIGESGSLSRHHNDRVNEITEADFNPNRRRVSFSVPGNEEDIISES